MHVGREHGENFECGLCEYIAEDLESLDVHLQTCEIYKCHKCENVFINLKDLKQHYPTEHTDEKENFATHMKQSREDKNSYDSRCYSLEEL